MSSRLIIRAAIVFPLVVATPTTVCAGNTRVEIKSDGWRLVGDLTVPETEPTGAVALLLHKAAGNRTAYTAMARALADRGIASLRVDLRGHGDSVNLGKFDPEISRYFDPDEPAVVRNFSLLRAGDADIVAIRRWLEQQSHLQGLPRVVVGSSYTGQEAVEAAAVTRFADLYVMLAPGSFSKQSIARIDPSGVPWLFVRADKELPFFPGLFDAIRTGSKVAEIWVLPGEGHATDLLDRNPKLIDRIIQWILKNLPA